MLFMWIGCALPDGTHDSFDIDSAHTDSTYTVRTLVPATVSDVDGARVLVVLDGDWYTRAAIRAADAAYDDGLQPVVVATIGYADGNERVRDFTPTSSSAQAGAGGFADFLDALEQEILPALPGSDERIWFGHSLGGLAVSQLWLERPDLADPVIAASPSYWWDDAAIFDAVPSDALGQRIFIAAGSQEPFGMVALAQEMARQLGDVARFELLPRRDHGSAVSPALRNGLQHLLEDDR